MARLGAALVALVAVWAGWWPLAAAFERRATEAWLDAQRAAGWQAEASDITMSGFPLRYTRHLVAPVLADPAHGWAWQAEHLELTRARHPRASSDPGTTLTLPSVQMVQTPWQTLSIATEQAQATLTEAEGDARIASLTAAVAGLRIVSDTDGEISLDRFDLSATTTDARPDLVRLSLNAHQITPPSRLADALAQADLAPATIERVEAAADVTFDRPWTIDALETSRPQPERIVLRDAGVRWGDLTLRIAGTLDVDGAGQPSGELLVKATNWRDLLSASAESGLIPEGVAGGIEGALELMSRLAGSPETLDIPLTFANGRIRLGPVRLGPAPILRLP